MIVSDYLSAVIDVNSLPETIKGITKFLGPRKRSFDGVAICGMSGALVGPIVALRLKKPLLVVRKDNNHHSSSMVEGDKSIRSYIIVDDCVDQGKTIKSIVKKINRFNGAKPHGIVLYNHNTLYDTDDIVEQISQELAVWIKGTGGNNNKNFYFK